MPATASSSAASQSSRSAAAGPPKSPKKPTSVKPFQLTQLQKTLNRRRQHLNKLTEEELQTVLDLVIETLYGTDGGGKKPTAGGASSTSGRAATGTLAGVVESLPYASDELQRPRATGGDEDDATTTEGRGSSSAGIHDKLKENVLFGLTAAFYASIDGELNKGQRNTAFHSVKTILGGIDVSRKDAVERNLRAEKDRREKEQQQEKAKAKEKERIRQQKEKDKQTNGNTTDTTGASGHKMGSLLSTANADDDSDDEVVILDGPPSPPPGGRKDRPLPAPKPKQEADDGNGARLNGNAAAAPAPPARPRHRQVHSVAPHPQAMTVLPDTQKPRYSASIHPRPKAKATFDASCDPQRGSLIDEVTLDDVRTRLATWDPYWSVVHEFSAITLVVQGSCSPNALEWGSRTGPVSAYQELGKRVGDLATAAKYDIKTAGAVTAHVDPSDVGVRAKLNAGPNGVMKWGKSASPTPSRYGTGDRRCILRMLPLYATDAQRKKHRKKRADTHLWPIGSFVQYNNHAVSIVQRKQQSHDFDEWKGMCHALDVTNLVSDPYSSNLPNRIDIAARDETPYAIHLAVCDFVGPDALYDRLMARNGPQSIPQYAYDEALKVALDYVKDQMVVLDSDDEDGDDDPDHEGSSQQFSLLCPLSMSAMETPVRGKGCRHIACFDLRNWLHNNVTVGGTRWRCAHCEDFLAPSDLLVDGIFCRFLEQTKGQISSARDKVQLNPDGTWTLMDANKLRYQGNKRGSGELGDSNGNALKRSKIEPGASSPVCGGGGAQEIIEIDSD